METFKDKDKDKDWPAYMTRKSEAAAALPTSARLTSSTSDCLWDVANWMGSNKLQSISSQTEVMWCARSRPQHLLTEILPASSLSVDGVLIVTLVSTSTPTSLWWLTINEPCRSIVSCFRSCGRYANWYRQPHSSLCGLPRSDATALRHSSRDWRRLCGRFFNYVAPTTSLMDLSFCTGCASRSVSSIKTPCWRIKFSNGLRLVIWVH